MAVTGRQRVQPMLLRLLIAASLALAAVVEFVQGRWRRGTCWAVASAVLLAAVIGYLLSWNAVMLKVQHEATTRAGR